MLILKKIKIKNFISIGNQFEEIDFTSANKTLVIGENGTGKEMPISEPVLTPNGWSTMGQLKPGDYVIGSSGLPIKVLSIHPQGVKDVYTVKTIDGVDIRCGKEHLWSVYIDDIFKTVTTGELLEKYINTSFCKLPKFSGLQGGERFGDTHSSLYSYTYAYALGFYAATHNRVDEHLTNFINYNYDSRLAILRGLMDAGGLVDNVHIVTFTSDSENILNIVRGIVGSLGGLSYPYRPNKISIMMPICPFRMKALANRWKFTDFDFRTIINSITIEDYQEEQVCITVDAEDQLYVTTGFKLTHNSSTILDSVVYALYGTAYRNINKNQLINNLNKSELLVELEFKNGENDYRVVRGQSPNIFDIYKNGEKMPELSSIKEQQRFFEEEIIKINYLTFSNIAILGSSGYIPFMEQPLATRRALIEELLDINLFGQMLSVAKDSSRELGEELRSQKETISHTEDSIKLLEGFIESDTIDYSQEIETVNENLAESLSNLNEKIAKKADFTEQLQKTVDYSKDINKLNDYTIEFKTIIKNENKKLKFYEQYDHCPTCNQNIDVVLKQDTTNKSNNTIDEYKTKIERAEQVLKTKKGHQDKYLNLKASLTNIEYEISHIKRQIKEYENRISELKKYTQKRDISGYTQQLDILRTNLLSYQQHFNTLKVDVSNYAIVIKILSDSGIKSKILEKYLPYFNNYINQYLKIFQFDINFQFNSLFKEQINSRHRIGFTYDSFSEGEKMKISLSIMLAFRDLASLKSTNSTNILIMDEIFDSSLDLQSTQNLMSILNTLVDHNIFIISHNSNVSRDDFDRTLLFSKDREFTKIQTI
jgi:DNA repair exonuclease SbcCD ATPase subunit